MANPTITTTTELKLDTYFVDGDTRSITIKNPKDDIQASEISALNTLIQTDNLLIGDKSGATFGKITKASVVTKVTTTYGTETITPE